ncbi:MAG: hypothetical protein N2689_17955, partial [Verrucomicrobiae bacterium]|nr:hypothetical protein [Verrucomicrobiae bacterium]
VLDEEVELLGWLDELLDWLEEVEELDVLELLHLEEDELGLLVLLEDVLEVLDVELELVLEELLERLLELLERLEEDDEVELALEEDSSKADVSDPKAASVFNGAASDFAPFVLPLFLESPFAMRPSEVSQLACLPDCRIYPRMRSRSERETKANPRKPRRSRCGHTRASLKPVRAGGGLAWMNRKRSPPSFPPTTAQLGVRHTHLCVSQFGFAGPTILKLARRARLFSGFFRAAKYAFPPCLPQLTTCSPVVSPSRPSGAANDSLFAPGWRTATLCKVVPINTWKKDAPCHRK